MKKFLNRLREPSSWAGLAALGSLAGLSLPPETMQAIVQAATGIAAVAAVLLPENKAG
jgi:hypothetical protein